MHIQQKSVNMFPVQYSALPLAAISLNVRKLRANLDFFLPSLYFFFLVKFLFMQ